MIDNEVSIGSIDGDDESQSLSVESSEEETPDTTDTRKYSSKGDQQIITERENRRIRLWRSVVIVALSLIGLTVSGLVYFFLAAEETDDFVDAVSLVLSKVELV